MARQDTTCIPPDQVSSWGAHIFAGAAGAALTAALATAALGGSAALAFGIGILFAPFGALSGYCDWYFNGRLVCIEDDRAAVAKVHLTEMNFDGDFTLNVLLSPTPPGSTLAEEQAGPQGVLMVNQHASLPFVPEGAGDPWNGTPIMHIEIEGTRMKSVCAGGSVGALVGAAVGAAVFAACAAALGWTLIGLLFCLIVALVVALVIGAAGAGIGYLAGSEASPSDAGETREISENDCVAFRGRWIYDSGHDGWNEIHAVMRIMKLDEDCLALTATRIREIIDQLRQADDPDAGSSSPWTRTVSSFTPR